ncbi:MAG: hypothetical protein CSB33_05645 [Desulfobacterales bacterium]|nr:MAG: hypothetical protein CSB33_05645 [Desulfobacterales bacterium]
MVLIPLLIAAYLIGSVNVPIVLFRVLGREDPRGRFSGNPGMANVYRQAGWKWALMVLLLEMGKAILVTAAAMAWLRLERVPWIGLGLIIGNLYPCFHRFQGGKGVANYLGSISVFRFSSHPCSWQRGWLRGRLSTGSPNDPLSALSFWSAFSPPGSSSAVGRISSRSWGHW